jgi:cation transport ATPase
LTERTADSVARVGPETLTIFDDRVFGPAGEALARRFARCVLRFDEVRSLALDPSRSSATLVYRPRDDDPAAFVTRLADAVAGSGGDLDANTLPRWLRGEPVTLHRHGEIISLLEILSTAGGRLLAHHPDIACDPALPRRVENILRHAPGVIEVMATSAKAEVRVRFNPRVIKAATLVRLVEAELLRPRSAETALSRERVDFAPANVSLGVAATGEFVLPIVTPVTAAMLVVSNLETFRDTVHQAREGNFGLPLLYTSIVGVTLATGQFLSAALMFWFFRYWEHRYRQDLAIENQALLEQTVGSPKEVRLLMDNDEAGLVPKNTVVVGQRVRVLAGEIVAIDARVLGGAALVDEAAVRGIHAPVRRVTGDQVLAGSRLIAGALDLEVLRWGDETQAARIAQCLTDATMPTPRSWALNRDAEEFAGRAVAPTFIAASAGLVVGDLNTAGAILRPDYATGIGLATPLETLRDVKLAVRNGAVIRSANAFGRLATTSWVLLEDHEGLHDAQCEVGELRINRSDENEVLPVAAAAGVWLGDGRGSALAQACRERGLIVRRADLREIDSSGVTVDYRGHAVRLHGDTISGADPPPPLAVELDGIEVGGIRFRRNGRLMAAAAVRRLQRCGLRVCLASSERSAEAAGSLASRLSVDRHCSGMRVDDKVQLLRSLRQSGVAAVFVGDCKAGAAASREAHLAIALAGDALGSEPSDIVLLGPSMASLPALFELARDHTRRVALARHIVVAPNLLCVVGAFSFGWTGLAAVFVSNFGTSMAYGRAIRSLRAPLPSAADPCWYEDDHAIVPAALATEGFGVRTPS